MDSFTERVLLAAEAASFQKRRALHDEDSSISTVRSDSAFIDTVVDASHSNFKSIHVLESKFVRDAFVAAILKDKESTRNDVFLYESASIFVANAAVDCTRLVLREESTLRFVSTLRKEDQQKCVVFSIFSRVVDYIACAFLDRQSEDDCDRLLFTTEKISNSIGQENKTNLTEIVKYARTAHRVSSRALESGELKEFLQEICYVCENSFSVKTTKDGAIRGVFTLFKEIR